MGMGVSSEERCRVGGYSDRAVPHFMGLPGGRPQFSLGQRHLDRCISVGLDLGLDLGLDFPGHPLLDCLQDQPVGCSGLLIPAGCSGPGLKSPISGTVPG